MSMPDNIVLIGMPAAGKSTVGVLLAKRIGYAFIDTDLLIQTGENRRLQHIIHDRGMEAFCDLEAAYVKKVSARRSVIATGGSVIYRSEAMIHLQTIGNIVFLDIDLIHLKKRLDNLDARGVVRPPGQSVDSLYLERRPLYQRFAQHTLTCSDLSPEAVVQALASIRELSDK
jgi:shikimate kinase